MRIVASDVALSSSHSLVEKDVRQQSLQVWGRQGSAGSQLKNGNGLSANLVKKIQQDMADISDKARALLQAKLRELQQPSQADSQTAAAEKDPKVVLIEYLLSALTGHKVTIDVPDLSKVQDAVAQATSQQAASQQAANQPAQQAAGVGWGLKFDSYEAHTEQESTTFSATGAVKTADGRQINFALDLAMSRQYSEEQRVSVKAGDALKDPLVINFGGAASLTATKYDFDLNADGAAEKISFVGPTSGFLALDANGDGKVNDGSELFGPQSGNGFADLAKYDSDGNGWIDEGDGVFSKLRVWTKDAQGADQLLSLAQAGVGAINLANVGSAFALKDTSNQLQGQIQTSGIFLRENGSAGTIQQVDLAV